MPAGNQILRWVLTLVVLGNCLPYFAFEDVNRDRRVDLFDAVVQVRNMVDATQAEQSGFYHHSGKLSWRSAPRPGWKPSDRNARRICSIAKPAFHDRNFSFSMLSVTFSNGISRAQPVRLAR